MSNYLRQYLKAGLSEIFVIDSKEWEESSGYQQEHETETVVARKGDSFVKVTAHERKSFAPRSGSMDVSLEPEEEITEAQYCDLVSDIPDPVNLDTDEAVAAFQKENHAEKKRLEKFNANTAERIRLSKELDKITPRCKNCGHEMRITTKNGRKFWACSRFPSNCEGGGFSDLTAEQSKLMAAIAKLRY